nr:tyrosine-type recombinase/integrase [Ruegeria arenilitoris]
MGLDPSAEKKAQKAAQSDTRLSNQNLVKTLIDQFDKRHLSRLKSGAQTRQVLERFVVSAWGERDVKTITRRDILDLLDDIVDSGRATTANRVKAHLSKFLNWCVERDILDISPALGVKAPAKEVSRVRFFSDDEIRWFWLACERAGEPWEAFGKTLLLTGQRRQEVARMTTAELNDHTWHLSGDRTKNGRNHDVPLSSAVAEVLFKKAQIDSPSGFVFTTNGVSPIQGFSQAKKRIARYMNEIAEAERNEPVEIPRWGFHDLRRTVATGMARIGIPVRVTEAVLNHVSGTGGGIVAVYQRHDYAEEKRQALNAWSQYVIDLIEA